MISNINRIRVMRPVSRVVLAALVLASLAHGAIADEATPAPSSTGFKIANQTNVSDNLASSQQRIQGSEAATTGATLTPENIQDQQGTAMLVQANAIPQNVLSLLR